MTYPGSDADSDSRAADPVELPSITIPSVLIDPFWSQLYKNIGRSTLWERFMVVEPTAAMLGGMTAVTSMEILDPLVCGGDRGTHSADYFDQGIESDREQFIGTKQDYTLLSSECPPLDWEDPTPLSLFLEQLKGNPRAALRLLGIAHYHAEDPKLSPGDLRAMTDFAGVVRGLNGPRQIGMVLSEGQPLETFNLRMTATMKEFVRHMRRKLESREVELVANLFDGSESFHPRIRVELTT